MVVQVEIDIEQFKEKLDDALVERFFDRVAKDPALVEKRLQFLRGLSKLKGGLALLDDWEKYQNTLLGATFAMARDEVLNLLALYIKDHQKPS